LLPAFFVSSFLILQVYELLFHREQKDPSTTVFNYYNQLDFQRFEKAFGFFKPSPHYPLDQFLLEKSVNEGGLLPSYAKLDSMAVKSVFTATDSATAYVFSRWNTSVGRMEKNDTVKLVLQGKKWYILPPEFIPEIPEEQVRSYTYTIFKKQGKRVISSFPTIKDDRVKKPFAFFKQVNFVRNGASSFITGEIVNTDDIPINIALKVSVRFQNDSLKHYFPATAFQYNLSPKAGSYFQINLDSTHILNSRQLKSIEIHAETDVSERGYLHGGTTGYAVRSLAGNQVRIDCEMYNELTTDINIPGILVAEKDTNGRIWQVQLLLHNGAVRSGLHLQFMHAFTKIQKESTLVSVPLTVFINGQQRKVGTSQKDEVANRNQGIALLPHCFMSQELYLQ
ncbi:MAG: hypothetical protein MUE38_06515, partial [Flavihumibacter sp.]|nr:hypothetical protein [Flavihumibacter sp.]